MSEKPAQYTENTTFKKKDRVTEKICTNNSRLKYSFTVQLQLMRHQRQHLPWLTISAINLYTLLWMCVCLSLYVHAHYYVKHILPRYTQCIGLYRYNMHTTQYMLE